MENARQELKNKGEELRRQLQASQVGSELQSLSGKPQEPTAPVSETKTASSKIGKDKAAAASETQPEPKPQPQEPPKEEPAPQTEPEPEPEKTEPKPDPAEEVVSKDKSDKWSDKDKKRYDRNWDELTTKSRKLDEEKQRFRQDQIETDSRLKQMRAEYAAMQEELAVFKKERPDVVQLKPDFYRDRAQKALEEGDMESYRLETKRADDLERDMQSWKQRQESEQRNFEHGRAYYRKELLSDYPDMAKADSPLHQKAVEVYNRGTKEFDARPDGEWQAVFIADLMLKAESATALSEEIERLKEERDVANSKLTLTPSSQAISKKRDLKSLPIDERRDKLRAALEGTGG